MWLWHTVNDYASERTLGSNESQGFERDLERGADLVTRIALTTRRRTLNDLATAS